MSTMDEIAKEKQRVGEALARIDAQREKLVSELADWKRPSVCSRVMAKPLEQRRRLQTRLAPRTPPLWSDHPGPARYNGEICW